MTNPGEDVFLSYKAEDRARLTTLVAALEAEGFSLWWDAHIGGGSNWQADIEQHLDAACCVLVVWTRGSVGPDGQFVRDEARRAQKRGAYLPILLDAVEPPLGFGEIQALPLKGWRGDREDPRFRNLVENLHRRIGSEPRVSQPIAKQWYRPTRRAILLGGGVTIAAAAAAGGWMLTRGSSGTAKRIAVLPFANLSQDREQDYFAAGLAEELRGALSRVGLEVIGRTSSEAVAEEDTASIVAKLNVAHVLTGSVRRSPERIRISAQLVDGDDGIETWAQSYDRSPGEAIAIQSDIARQVAQSLRIALGTIDEALELGSTSDTQAQDFFLQSLEIRQRQGASREALTTMQSLLTRAIERDPEFARAWIARGRAAFYYAIQYSISQRETARFMTQAERDVRQGLAIAPNLAFGRGVLAEIAAGQLRFHEALEGMQAALALSPNDPLVLATITNQFAWIGPTDQAVETAERLVSLEPLSPTSYSALLRANLAARRYDDARAAGRNALEFGPDNFNALVDTATVLIAMGDLAQAQAMVDRIPANDTFRLAYDGIIAARRNQTDRMEVDLARLMAQDGDIASYQYAQIYAAARRNDEAFAALETAVAVTDPGLIYTLHDPMLAPLHDDPRFAALLRRLDFPGIDPA